MSTDLSDFAWLVLGYLLGYFVGKWHWTKVGRDAQWCEERMREWSRESERRDPKSGRFRKCSLTCTRNECGDTSEVKQ